MALKPVYVIEGQRWLPLPRAAKMLATNMATIKRLMGDGTLEWRQLYEGWTTFVVEEAGIIRLRAERNTARTEVQRRTTASTRTARQRNMAQGYSERAASAENAAIWAAKPRLSVFDKTWDPSPYPLPISGRTPKPPEKP